MKCLLAGALLSAAVLGCSLQPDLEAQYLALGDSYTIGASVSSDRRWPAQLATRLTAAGIDLGEVGYLARTGWTTSRLLEALDQATLYPPYRLVSLLIGVNNEYQGLGFSVFEQELAVLLVRAVELTGGDKARVFVLSIPDYTYTPFGQRASASRAGGVTRYNAFLEKACADAGIRFFYITDITDQGLADPALVASDGLHPSAKAYGLIAERIFPGVLELLRR